MQFCSWNEIQTIHFPVFTDYLPVLFLSSSEIMLSLNRNSNTYINKTTHSGFFIFTIWTESKSSFLDKMGKYQSHSAKKFITNVNRSRIARYDQIIPEISFSLTFLSPHNQQNRWGKWNSVWVSLIKIRIIANTSCNQS